MSQDRAVILSWECPAVVHSLGDAERAGLSPTSTQGLVQVCGGQALFGAT